MKKITFEEALKLPHAEEVLTEYKLLNDDGTHNMKVIMSLSKDKLELLAFYIQYFDKPGVKVNCWQLGGADPTNKNTFNKEYRVKLLRSNMIYSIEYYIRMQFQYDHSGRWYELLEDETEKWWPQHLANREEREAIQQREDDAKETIETALSSIRKPRATKAKPKIEAPKAEAKQKWGVSENFEQFEDPSPEDGIKYIFEGSEDECDEYVKKHCPTEGSYEAFVIEMRTRKPPINVGTKKFEEEKARRIKNNKLNQ